TGQVAGDRTAQRAPARFAIKQRPVVDGLESEFLVVLLKQRLDFGERRAGARREHEFGRLIQCDATQFREIEGEVRLARPPNSALGPLSGELERLFVAERPAHGLSDLFRVTGFQGVSHYANTFIPPPAQWAPERRPA